MTNQLGEIHDNLWAGAIAIVAFFLIGAMPGMPLHEQTQALLEFIQWALVAWWIVLPGGLIVVVLLALYGPFFQKK